MVTDTGLVISAGDATGYGMPSQSGLCHNNNSASMVASASGHGYWVIQRDGTILNFGDASPFGNASNTTANVVGIDITK